MSVEIILIPREMMKQRNSTVAMTIGEVIPFKSFTAVMPHYEWAQKVKSVVYSLT